MSDTPLSDLFAAATGGQEVSKAEILELAAGCTIRDLNLLISDLNKQSGNVRRQAYDLATTAGYLSDEVRRRAEQFEADCPDWCPKQ